MPFLTKEEGNIGWRVYYHIKSEEIVYIYLFAYTKSIPQNI